MYLYFSSEVIVFFFPNFLFRTNSSIFAGHLPRQGISSSTRPAAPPSKLHVFELEATRPYILYTPQLSCPNTYYVPIIIQSITRTLDDNNNNNIVLQPIAYLTCGKTFSVIPTKTDNKLRYNI